MSLKVWLPLNGDLGNKGASDEVITDIGTGNSWKNNGKTGSQCLTLTKISGTIAVPSMIGGKQLSFAYWIKVNNAWSTNWLDGIRWYTWDGTTDTYSRQEFYSNCTQVGVWFAGSPNSISGKSFTINEWRHIAFTIDYFIGKACFYIDGNLVGSTTGINTTHYIKTGNFILGDNGVDIDMNDVRIYDHCLSAAEVKEISQGLVLHYKLDDNYIENTTNLYNGTFSNTCYNGAVNQYSYGTNTDMYKTTGNFQGKECVKVYMGTAGKSAYPYVYFDAFSTTGTNVQTLSFDYFPTIQSTIIPYSYNGTYNISYTTSNGEKNESINTSQIIIPVIINQWNHITITMQKYDTTSTTRGNGYIRIGSSAHTSTTTDYWLFANIQIENKDHETGYTIPGTTRSTTLIQDSSGYGNNGNVTGNLLINSSTPRYSNSIKLNDSASSIGIGDLSVLLPEKIFTFNIWFKKNTNEWSSKSWETILGGPSGFELEGKLSSTTNAYIHPYSWGGGSTTTPNSYSIEYSLDEWHMLTMVRTTSNTKFYLDGELKVTGSAGSIPSGDYFIGAWKTATQQNYRGLFSDVRIYCTPLLDTDIKQLYNTNMKIDNLSNMHTFNIKEQERNLLAGAYITSGMGNRTNPFTNYNSKGEMTFTDTTSAGSDYIPIFPTNHTYEYDITYSFDSGNHFYIGFERYDIDKTARSNNACVYIVDSTSGADHNRIKGTVNLSTDTVNQCRYIALRVLNGWYNTTGTATIHNMSLHEVSTPRNHSQLTEQGNFIIDEIKENQKASFYKNGIVEAHNFIEK